MTSEVESDKELDKSNTLLQNDIFSHNSLLSFLTNHLYDYQDEYYRNSITVFEDY